VPECVTSSNVALCLWELSELTLPMLFVSICDQIRRAVPHSHKAAKSRVLPFHMI
jgi:hypothetical protein